MKKIIILILCFNIQILFVYASQKSNYQKQLITVVQFNNGKNWMMHDINGMLANFKKRNNFVLNENTKELNNNINFKIQPNPIISNVIMSFELLKYSDIRVFITNNNNIERQYFEGNLNKGIHELSFNLNDFEKGLVIIYLQIDGKITAVKGIKI